MRVYAAEASRALELENDTAIGPREGAQTSPPPLQQLNAVSGNAAHRNSPVLASMTQRYPAAAAAAQARRAEALQRNEARERCEHVAVERRDESEDAKAKLVADRDAAEATKWRRQACRALDERRDGKSMDRLVARLKQQWVREVPVGAMTTRLPQSSHVQLVEHEIAATVRARRPLPEPNAIFLTGNASAQGQRRTHWTSTTSYGV